MFFHTGLSTANKRNENETDFFPRLAQAQSTGPKAKPWAWAWKPWANGVNYLWFRYPPETFRLILRMQHTHTQNETGVVFEGYVVSEGIVIIGTSGVYNV